MLTSPDGRSVIVAVPNADQPERRRHGRKHRTPGTHGHPTGVVETWRRGVASALANGARTPFYLLDPSAVRARLDELDRIPVGMPLRHWLSVKTLPVPEMIRWWVATGRPVEVVSEVEFDLAARCGIATENVLVNGPAKHRWLPALSRGGLRVNFDSPGELEALLPIAARDRWEIGLRLATTGDGSDPFGMTGEEAARAVARLHGAGLEVSTLHVHPGSNLRDPEPVRQALGEMARVCDRLGLRPRHVDVGGGLPAPHVLGRGGRRLDAGISIASYAEAVRSGLRSLPGIEGVWMEHGRHLLAGAAVLAVGVLDRKSRDTTRCLICDGGRVMNAWMSLWEDHAIHPLVPRDTPPSPMAIHGPTCMAFDRLGMAELPADVGPGDVLLWLDAGAYHIPLETGFSHRPAEIWWWEGDRPPRPLRAPGCPPMEEPGNRPHSRGIPAFPKTAEPDLP